MSVLRFEITERLSPVLDPAGYGKAGAFERILGRALCDIDPEHPLNRGIVNLDKAPRNAAGRVEYSVDVAILKPIDLSRGNGWLFYEYLNRGSQRGIVRINNAPVVAMPRAPEDAGDGFLMREGYSVVWTAWQGNVEPGGGRLIADLPVARDADGPITGPAREEVILDAPDSIRGSQVEELDSERFVLTLSYPAASLDPAAAQLTSRRAADAPRTEHPGVSWRFLDARRIEVHVPAAAGLDRGTIHEFSYRACDPVVMGIGYASVRDLIAFFRHETHDSAGNPNPFAPAGRPAIRRAMGFGLSQSGRVLRDFLYEGFNEDLHGRCVFDGVVPIIGGSRRAWVNAPFSQPGRYSRQHEEHDFPGDQFPFGYVPLQDARSGRSGSVLDRARAAGVCPKLMHLDTDSEYWSARASLIVTDADGNDLVLPDDVRVYLVAGIAHGDYPLPSAPVVNEATNPLTYGPILRALIRAMQEWVEDGVPPPPNCHPTRADGTLLDLPTFRARFPAIPDMAIPRTLNALLARDADGVPLPGGSAYTVLVPATDGDGNGCAGILHPLVAAPAGTHTGWTIRADGFAPGNFYSVYGAFRPFASSDDRDGAPADPRPGFHSRYATRQRWSDAVAAAADALVARRLMLPDDARILRDRCRDAANPYKLI